MSICSTWTDFAFPQTVVDIACIYCLHCIKSCILSHALSFLSALKYDLALLCLLDGFQIHWSAHLMKHPINICMRCIIAGSHYRKTELFDGTLRWCQGSVVFKSVNKSYRALYCWRVFLCQVAVRLQHYENTALTLVCTEEDLQCKHKKIWACVVFYAYAKLAENHFNFSKRWIGTFSFCMLDRSLNSSWTLVKYKLQYLNCLLSAVLVTRQTLDHVISAGNLIHLFAKTHQD